MNFVEKIVAFYGSLAAVIRDEDFGESSAVPVLQLYVEINSESVNGPGVTISDFDFTLDFLREAHEEYHDPSRDMNILEKLTEAAFKDMARYMRFPQARKVFTEFADMCGTWGPEDLYVQTINVRPLNDWADSMAVVTLVVNSYDGLKDLLENGRKGQVEYIHSV